jgi:hypothetical protein
MIVCPVCEHSQEAGAECDLCGKRFAPGTAPLAQVAPMEGLEPTLHLDESDPFELSEGMPELEPTAVAAVDAPEEITPDVERTCTAPVEVDAPAMADIERIRDEIPVDAPTALPLAPVCRYCRTPAVPGEMLCSRCGMRLAVIDPNLIPTGSETIVLCSHCGSISTREVCPACGSRRAPSAGPK